MLVAGPADPVLPLGASTPFLAALSCSLSREQLHHSDPRSAAVPLGPPMRRYAPFARDATAGRLHSRFLFLSLARSLTHPSTLVRLLPRPLFALFLSLRLIFFSLSWLLLSSLVRLPPSSPSQPLSLFLFLFQHPCDAAHTRARVPRAIHNTHGRSATLTCGVCGPTSCRGPCHVAPRPQRHAARSTDCALS